MFEIKDFTVIRKTKAKRLPRWKRFACRVFRIVPETMYHYEIEFFSDLVNLRSSVIFKTMTSADFVVLTHNSTSNVIRAVTIIPMKEMSFVTGSNIIVGSAFSESQAFSN